MLRVEQLAGAAGSPRDRALILCGGILGWTAEALTSATFEKLLRSMADMVKAGTLERGLFDRAAETLKALGLRANDVAFTSNSPRSKGQPLDRTVVFRIVREAARRAWGQMVRGGIGLLRVLARMRCEAYLWAQGTPVKRPARWSGSLWARGIRGFLQDWDPGWDSDLEFSGP